jgi:hypothetical protein
LQPWRLEPVREEEKAFDREGREGKAAKDAKKNKIEDLKIALEAAERLPDLPLAARIGGPSWFHVGP